MKGLDRSSQSVFPDASAKEDGGFPTRERLGILDECSASVRAAAAALVEPQDEEVSEEPAPWLTPRRVRMLLWMAPSVTGAPRPGSCPTPPDGAFLALRTMFRFSPLLRFTADSPPVVIRAARRFRPLNTKAVPAATVRSTCVWLRAQVLLVDLRSGRSSFHLFTWSCLRRGNMTEYKLIITSSRYFPC